MLVVFDAATHTVAQVIGKAANLTGNGDINTVAAAVFKASLKSSPNSVPPVTKLAAGEYAAFRIKPDQIRMAYYDKSQSNDHRKIFESIESFELK
jgi:hypothetical protein